MQSPSSFNPMLWAMGILTVIASVADSAHATFVTVPEIDTASLATGLGLLTGAVLIVRSRMRR